MHGMKGIHFAHSVFVIYFSSRLMTAKSNSLFSEMDSFLQEIEPLEDNAAFNFINALEDLLWAFELRATASWVFQLAIKRRIYCQDMFRYFIIIFASVCKYAQA